MQKVEIQYVPYVGLVRDTKFVKTKIKNDGKLYFFECGGVISSDDFEQSTIDELIANPIDGLTLLGYVELKK